MDIVTLLVIVLLLLTAFNTLLLFGVCSMLLKIADRLNKQEEEAKEEAEEQPKVEEADGVPADLLIYNPYSRPPVGKLDRSR